MYAVDVICSNGHQFEGLFADRQSFEDQRESELIECPVCGDFRVQQALTPVRIKRHGKAPARPAPRGEAQPTPQRMLAYVNDHFEDVGTRFAEEAIKMHTGESESRNIRGTATQEEEQQLEEEGIPFLKLPDVQ